MTGEEVDLEVNLPPPIPDLSELELFSSARLVLDLNEVAGVAFEKLDMTTELPLPAFDFGRAPSSLKTVH